MSLSSVSRLPRLRFPAHVEMVTGGKDAFALQIKKWMAGVLAQGAYSCGCGGHNIAVAGQRTGQTVLKTPRSRKCRCSVRVA